MAETITSTSRTPSHRRWRRLAIGFGLPAVCLLLCYLLYWYVIIRPDYIELDVPFPDGYGWFYTEKTIRIPDGSGAAWYIWKREGLASGSRDSIVAYFDEQLSNRGWTRTEESYCEGRFIEARFLNLKLGNGGYVVYRRTESINMPLFSDKRSVCLAVWNEEGESGFYVALATLNPSFLEALQD